jgi:SAM-dependent methyltransferase
MNERRVLDLGCGRDKLPGAFGIDTSPLSEADLVRNLDDLPWPLADSSFDHVRAQDVLEHVTDFFAVVREIHRVSRPGATVEVRMPFMSSVNLATDPTHRRAATSRTFDYFDPRTPLGRYDYSSARFEVVEFRYVRSHIGAPGRALKRIDWALVPFLERHALTYETYFAYLYPMQDVWFRLRVVKS